ncbi:hypothetical protein GCM10027569_11240 [Flindersiella endophytica]
MRLGGLFVLALTAVLGAGFGPAARADEQPPRIELVLDVSGSMRENDAGGMTRMAAAKQALTAVIDGVPDEAEVGLRFYGHTYPGDDKAAGCKDTALVAPVGRLDKAAAKAKVDALEPVGFTPIGTSLRQAGADLGTRGQRRIILISDGEDTCAPPDPCDVARELKKQGIELAIDTVGFNVNAKARAQLQCIARVTDGTYGDAKDAGELSSRVQGMFKRALQAYEPVGKPVKGSPNGCEDAPVLTAGQYVDHIRGGSQRHLRYRLDLAPGQRVRVSFTAVLNQDSGTGWGLAAWMGRADELDSLPNYDNDAIADGQAQVTVATGLGRTTWEDLHTNESSVPLCVVVWPRVGSEGTEVPAEIQVAIDGKQLTYDDLPESMRTAKPVPTKTATPTPTTEPVSNKAKSGPSAPLAVGVGIGDLLAGCLAGVALGGRR